MAKFIKGHNHAKLGLHRLGGNLYSKGGRRFKRVHGGFREIVHHKAGYDPLAPLTGKNLSQELNAATRLKYGPQEQQLASESRISGVQQQRIGDWFGNYRAQLAQAQQATQAGYNQAQQGVYNQANTAAGQDEAARQRLQAQAQQSAAVRGTSASVQPEAQQAAQAQRALSSSFGGMIGAQGAAAGRYAGAQRIAGAQAEVGAHQDESKRQRQITALGRQLAADKGDYRTQLRGQLRDSERTYALNQQAFGLDVSKAQAQAAHQARQDKNVARGQNLVARSHHLDRLTRIRLKKIDAALKRSDLSEKHRHNLVTERQGLLRINKPSGRGGRGGGSGAKPSFTPTQARANRSKWEGYVGDLRLGRRKGKPPTGASPLLWNAAREYVKHGYVSYRTYKRLVGRYGFHPPTRKPHRSGHAPGPGGGVRPN